MTDIGARSGRSNPEIQRLALAPGQLLLGLVSLFRFQLIDSATFRCSRLHASRDLEGRRLLALVSGNGRSELFRIVDHQRQMVAKPRDRHHEGLLVRQIALGAGCKSAIVDAVRRKINPDAAVLCFGDSGSRFGNDYTLLAHPHGISVGEVCGAADGCWSLFGRALTGPDALLKILRALVKCPTGEIRLDTAALALDTP